MVAGSSLAVAPASRWQLRSVIATLAEAFADDPAFRWIFPEPDLRAAQTLAWWERLVGRRPPGARTWQVADVAAAALWHPPRPAGIVPVPDADFAGWFTDLVEDDVLAAERFELFAEILASHPSERYWYLAGVGTRPGLQGKGLGSALLGPMLARCDDDGVAAYLESSNPRNVPFYRRHGFEVVGTIPLPDGSSEITPMRRPPA